MKNLILATEQGIVICELEDKEWHKSFHSLQDQHVHSPPTELQKLYTFQNKTRLFLWRDGQMI